MKRFLWSSYNILVAHAVAARMGWDSPEHGWELLDALALGETIIDEDGGTWRRVE